MNPSCVGIVSIDYGYFIEKNHIPCGGMGVLHPFPPPYYPSCLLPASLKVTVVVEFNELADCDVTGHSTGHSTGNRYPCHGYGCLIQGDNLLTET